MLSIGGFGWQRKGLCGIQEVKPKLLSLSCLQKYKEKGYVAFKKLSLNH